MSLGISKFAKSWTAYSNRGFSIFMNAKNARCNYPPHCFFGCWELLTLLHSLTLTHLPKTCLQPLSLMSPYIIRAWHYVWWIHLDLFINYHKKNKVKLWLCLMNFYFMQGLLLLCTNTSKTRLDFFLKVMICFLLITETRLVTT